MPRFCRRPEPARAKPLGKPWAGCFNAFQPGKLDDIVASSIPPEEAKNLSGLLEARIRRTPDKIAYRQYDVERKTWRDHSWADIGREVLRWRAALVGAGLAAGDRVALMLKNCVEWVIFDQAALGLGLVVVPLYLDDRADNAAYILQHCGARLLLVEGRFQNRKVGDILATSPGLEQVVSLVPPSDLTNWSTRIVPAAAWLAQGQGVEVTARHISGDMLASIVYTSGTTGRPKGVMLSHDNILCNAWYASQCARFGDDERFLSFLPLSHTFERTGGYYMPMLMGAEVVFARSVAQLGQDLQEQRPTVLVSVPRIYERVYARIQGEVEKKSALERRIFQEAVNLGWLAFEVSQGRARWHPKLLAWPFLRKKVAAPIQAKLGGRLRFAISGGAALNPDIARLFLALGVPLHQGYGLTEASPVISVNRPDSNIPSSIGKPIPGVEVKIGELDELLTRGRCVMRGYWNDPEATAAAIDHAGWLHTGDQARVDEAGHYYIVGRIKDIIVLNNGEKIPPADMESAICLDPLFEQAMVVGEGQPFLAALVVLNAEHWEACARSLGADPANPDALGDPKIKKALLLRMGEHLAHFPGYAQVRRLHATLEPWTVENGMLTPTLKTRRAPLLARYQKEIERLYADFSPSSVQ